MKRLALLTYMIIMFLVVLSGCTLIEKDNTTQSNFKNDISDYQVLVYDYSDSIPSAKHEVEYEFADHEKYDNQLVENEVQFSLNGKKYDGKYQSKQYNAYNYYPTYRYIDSEGNNLETDDKGLLTFFFNGNASSNGERLTEDDCLQIAKDFLGDIVDVSQYEVEVEDNKEGKYYTVNFKKYINDVETADKASVDVRYNGEIDSYSSFMLGRVTAENIAENVDTEGAIVSVNKKLDQIYEDAKKVYSRVEYSEPDIMLTVLKDGSTGLICTVNVNCVEELGEYEVVLSERINFVVDMD